jgi:hypothetical protein
LGVYEETRKRLRKHGYGKNESKIVASLPLANVPYIAGKSLVKSLGGGKHSDTNGIAPAQQAITSQLGQLRSLRAQKDAGQITPEQYEMASLPIIQSAHQNVNAAVSRGSTWANGINPIWQAFQDEGFAKPVNGKWVSDTGKVFWG